MAQKDRFFIGPMNSGLQNDVKPWLLPDDAFSKLNNAYVFRGSLKKRFGSYLIGDVEKVDPLRSRLRINLGKTDPITGNLAGSAPGIKYNIGQQFSIGTEVFTVTTIGAPADMITTGSATKKKYNTTNGAFEIEGATVDTTCYFYPADPVMGLPSYEGTAINFEPLWAFDTQFAYEYISGAFARLGTALWSGTDSDYFWHVNYRGITPYDIYSFVTNFVAADGIKYWNGLVWNVLNPKTSQIIAPAKVENKLVTCKIIISFKNRLLALNTIESIDGSNKNFANRCRYSQNGDPFDTDAWQEITPAGRGGWIDAPVKEQIVSAQLLRDRLIVFFERSSWELVYTGNQITPFVWQQINSELGVESSFSSVPFDGAVIGIGNVGIHACTGASVDRIDNLIPDEVFNIKNTDSAVNRVYGIRDYFSEMVYWTFPTDTKFSKKILAYNYAMGSWAFFDDSFTCFGYYQPSESKTWEISELKWLEYSEPWKDPQFKAQYRTVAAGNQQGFVSIFNVGLERNAPALSIANISGSENEFVVIDHTLSNGDYVLVENISSDFALFEILNDKIFQVEFVDDDTIKLLNENGSYIDIGAGDTYFGKGTISRVSQIDIETKEYNFYREKGASVEVSKVDFFVDKTAKGEVTVDYFTSSSDISLRGDSAVSKSIMGNGTLETFAYPTVTLEASQTRVWHPVYFQAHGDDIKLRIFLTPAQMFDPDIALSPFRLNAMIFHATTGGYRLG